MNMNLNLPNGGNNTNVNHNNINLIADDRLKLQQQNLMQNICNGSSISLTNTSTMNNFHRFPTQNIVMVNTNIQQQQQQQQPYFSNQVTPFAMSQQQIDQNISQNVNFVIMQKMNVENQINNLLQKKLQIDKMIQNSAFQATLAKKRAILMEIRDAMLLQQNNSTSNLPSNVNDQINISQHFSNGNTNTSSNDFTGYLKKIESKLEWLEKLKQEALIEQSNQFPHKASQQSDVFDFKQSNLLENISKQSFIPVSNHTSPSILRTKPNVPSADLEYGKSQNHSLEANKNTNMELQSIKTEPVDEWASTETSKMNLTNSNIKLSDAFFEVNKSTLLENTTEQFFSRESNHTSLNFSETKLNIANDDLDYRKLLNHSLQANQNNFFELQPIKNEPVNELMETVSNNSSKINFAMNNIELSETIIQGNKNDSFKEIAKESEINKFSGVPNDKHLPSSKNDTSNTIDLSDIEFDNRSENDGSPCLSKNSHTDDNNSLGPISIFDEKKAKAPKEEKTKQTDGKIQPGKSDFAVKAPSPNICDRDDNDTKVQSFEEVVEAKDKKNENVTDNTKSKDQQSGSILISDNKDNNLERQEKNIKSTRLCKQIAMKRIFTLTDSNSADEEDFLFTKKGIDIERSHHTKENNTTKKENFKRKNSNGNGEENESILGCGKTQVPKFLKVDLEEDSDTQNGLEIKSGSPVCTMKMPRNNNEVNETPIIDEQIQCNSLENMKKVDSGPSTINSSESTKVKDLFSASKDSDKDSKKNMDDVHAKDTVISEVPKLLKIDLTKDYDKQDAFEISGNNSNDNGELQRKNCENNSTSSLDNSINFGSCGLIEKRLSNTYFCLLCRYKIQQGVSYFFIQKHFRLTHKSLKTESIEKFIAKGNKALWYYCKICNARYGNLSQTADHIQKSHLRCPKCSIKFRNETSVQYHARKCYIAKDQSPTIKFSNSSLRCSKCSMMFRNKISLQYHSRVQCSIKKDQSPTINVSTSDCVSNNQKTKLSEPLTSLEDITHTFCEYLCPLYCKPSFQSYNDVMRHIEEHYSSGPYSHLEPIRLLLEEKETLFRSAWCTICQIVLPNTLELSDHFKTHHSDKVISEKRKSVQICEYCKVIFSDRRFLLNHCHAKHNIIFNFTCKLCHETYQSYPDILTHAKNKHRNKRPLWFTLVLEKQCLNTESKQLTPNDNIKDITKKVGNDLSTDFIKQEEVEGTNDFEAFDLTDEVNNHIDIALCDERENKTKDENNIVKESLLPKLGQIFTSNQLNEGNEKRYECTIDNSKVTIINWN